MFKDEDVLLALKLTEEMNLDNIRNCDLPLPLKYASLVSVNFANKITTSEEGLDTLVDEFISENKKIMGEMFPNLDVDTWKTEVKSTLLAIINE